MLQFAVLQHPMLKFYHLNRMDWYKSLNKSSLTPPSWIFSPVWTCLYILIGYSFYLYVTAKGPALTLGVTVFVLHMLTNFAWAPIFFVLKQPTWALVDISLMLVTLVYTIYLFKKRSILAAALLLPYLAWVSFATYLNYEIVRLNK